MRRLYLLLLLAFALRLFWFEVKPKPETLPQTQMCDQTSCPLTPSNEQLFQREQQKQYLEQHP